MVTVAILTEGQVVAQILDDRIVEAARHLLYDHDSYFLGVDRATLIPVEKLVLTRARSKGIQNAVKYMEDARHGKIDRRIPIDVSPVGNGLYLVRDGNSTVTIATAAAWRDVPCTITDDTGNRNEI